MATTTQILALSTFPLALGVFFGPTSTAHADRWNDLNDPQRFGGELEYVMASLPKAGSAEQTPWPPSYTPEYVASGGASVAFDSASTTALPTLSDGTEASWTSIQAAVDPCPLRRTCDEQEDIGHDETYFTDDGDVDGDFKTLYMGLCQGWVAASILEPEPQLAIRTDSTEPAADSDGVLLEAMDLELLLAAAFSTTIAQTSGMQCRLVDGSDETTVKLDDALGKTAEKVAACQVSGVDEDGFLTDPGEWTSLTAQLNIDEDGFVQEPECVDGNAGTFHLLLTNLIGLQGRSFAVDRSVFDTVWLAPVVSFEMLTSQQVSAKELYAILDELGWALLDLEAASYRYVETNVTFTDPSQKSGYSQQDYAYVLEIDEVGEVIGGTWAAGYLDVAPDFFLLPTGPAAEIEGLDTSVLSSLAGLADASMDADGDGVSDSVYDLSDLVCSLGLHSGTENSLLASADAAVSSAERDSLESAANQVEAFVSKVEAQLGKKIDEDTALMLVDFAGNVILAL